MGRRKACGVRIHDKIEQKGVKLGYSTVKDYLSHIRKKDNIFIRIHVLPEEAQMDFDYITYIAKQKEKDILVFNILLSYS